MILVLRGIPSDPGCIDEQFRKAWLPSSVGQAGGLSTFLLSNAEVGGWLPSLDEVDFPALLSWGWRDLKALPVAWFDWLAVILSGIELDGFWPDGLRDAYIAAIPKADGYVTPIGERPLCVLPVVYRLWASVWLGHLESWLRSCLHL